MTVTTEDLRRLLGSGTRAELVLTEGRVEIREQEDDPDAGYLGDQSGGSARTARGIRRRGR